MKIAQAIIAIGVFATPLAALSEPAAAATAHNSQAGGMGNTSNNAAPAGMTKRMRGMSHHGRRMHHGRTMRHKAM